MVARSIVSKNQGERIADSLSALRAETSKKLTAPMGVRILETDEDLQWGNLDGSTRSVRNVDSDLAAAQGRIDAATKEIEAAAGRLDTLENVTLPGAVEALEAADAAAQSTLSDLDSKLSSAASSADLSAVREQIASAQAAASQAQATADQATSAASAANQAALHAAGIADSKGRVIYSDTAPTGADRSSSNLWIQPSTEKTFTWNGTRWEEITSDSLKKAAQDALDAKAAAATAQSTAETAAAKAQQAIADAAKAQQTADEATLDARLAHNAAVDAQAALDAVRSDMAKGPSLWPDPSFEYSQGPVPRIYGTGSIVRSQEWAASGLWSIKYTADGSGGNVFGAYGWADIVPGRWYALSATVHAGAASQQWRIVPEAYRVSGDTSTRISFIALGTGFNGASDGTLPAAAQATVSDTWIFQAPAEAKAVRYWCGLPVATNGAGRAGEVIYLDDLRLVDVTESYPQVLAAQKAAEDAQKRADSAYSLAESRPDQAAVDAAADAAEAAAKAAAAADAQAKADRAKADALLGAATDAASKAAAAQAAAIAAASEDAAVKASQALQDALAALKAARGEITAEIKASANGKNAITISTAAPSGPGVVVGDTWWRIDGSGNIFGQWRWTGSAWSAVTIRSEVIANLDVHKLTVTGDAKIAEAVIEKLWVDGLAAKAITTARLTVSTGNLIPDGLEMLEDSRWAPLTLDTVDHPADVSTSRRTAPGQGSVALDPSKANAFPVTPGQEYVAEVWVKADKPGSRLYMELRDLATGVHAGVGSLISPVEKYTSGYFLMNAESVPTTWTKYVGVWKPNAGVSKVYLGTAYFNHTSGTERGAQVWVAGLSLRPKVGAVLIEDGAITTPKLTVTEAMAGKIADFMSLAARQLVVTSTLADDDTAGKLGGVYINEQGIVTNGPTGSVVLNSTGLTQYATNPDGVAEPVVQLGTGGDTTENVFTAGDTVLSRASVSSPQGNFDALTVAGDDITDLLARGPRGVVAWGQLTENSDFDSDASRHARRLEVQTVLQPDRMYRVSLSSHYLNTSSSSARAVETLRYSFDKQPIYGTDPINSGAYTGSAYRQYLIGNSVYAVPGQEFVVDTAGWSTERHFWVMYLVKPESTSWPVQVLARKDYPVTLLVEDTGPSLAPTGKRWNDSNGGGVQDTAPQLVTKTATWGAGGFGGDTGAGEVIQGSYGSYGNRYGGWIFPTAMVTELGKAKSIKKFEVYLYASHWYYGSGGTASIRPNNGQYKSTFGTTQVESPKWPRRAGRWVTVPSTWHQYLMNGTYKGMSVQTSNTSLTHYGRFTGSATKFRVTYTV